MRDSELLEKIDGIPVFVQVREKLREEVLSGKYKPGSQLPSEDELASQFSISRITLRRSIEDLVKEGLIYRRHGQGTFVAHKRIDRDHSRLTSFFEEEMNKGRQPAQVILERTEIDASHKVAKELDLKDGEAVYHIKVLQLSNDEPVTLMDAYVPRSIYPDLLSKNLNIRSIWRIIEESGFTVKWAVQRIEACIADEDCARILKIEPGDPILYKERIVYTDSGTPVEYIECFNRGDLVTVTSVLYC